MHEIPPQAEAMLREHGVTDAELDELRRTGRLHRGDDAGSSIQVHLASSTSLAGDTASNTIVLDDGSLAAAQFTPEVLAQLRRFHRFIPTQARHDIERATGEDIDGDGHIGPPGSTPSAASASGTPPHEHASALPSAQGTGPFVSRRRPGPVGTILVAVALLALGAWLAMRFA